MSQPVVLRPQPARRVEQVDSQGDLVFQFRLKPVPEPESLTLHEVYRQQLYDLLQIVRLYHRGEPLIVDEFAFHDSPDQRVRIVGDGPEP